MAYFADPNNAAGVFFALAFILYAIVMVRMALEKG